jgi:type III secretion system FlhB-like substrate exporter
METSVQLDKEIIDSFKEEANVILEELKSVIEKLEEVETEFPKELLEEFANKTDRIMGTANTFYTQFPDHEIFKQIGNFGGLCKATGYKASTLNYLPLIPIFAGFWADTLEIMEALCSNIENPEKIAEINKSSAPILQKRLVWLAEQIVQITKSQGVTTQAAMNVDGLLRKLGIDV